LETIETINNVPVDGWRRTIPPLIQLWTEVRERLAAAAQAPIGRADIIKQLVDSIEHGVNHIQNGVIRDETAAWRAYAEWEHRVRELLKQAGASESDQSYFYTLGVYHRRGLKGKTELLTKLREESAEKIQRLREIVRRLEERSP
jgi:DNA repair photolyase